MINETFDILEHAFYLCYETWSTDYTAFIDSYVFGSAFYAFMSGYKPDMPVCIIYDFLSLKKKEYLLS